MPWFLANFRASHRRDFSPISVLITISVKDRVVSAQRLPSIDIATGVAVGEEFGQ
jgi:hypothetical protein